LICPKGGTVLDPFAGTGTTGAAAFIEGCRAVLIEREAEYLADIERRMELLLSGPRRAITQTDHAGLRQERIMEGVVAIFVIAGFGFIAAVFIYACAVVVYFALWISVKLFRVAQWVVADRSGK
jgi:16S rRNA G966 N2-methylase RsmD